MYAYKEFYLEDARMNLGEAFDYAVHYLNMSVKCFMKLMITTGYAKWFEHGVARIVVGMSGIELVKQVCQEAGYPYEKELRANEVVIEYEPSVEYWMGYTLAYAQWYTNCSFSEILEVISLEEMERMYGALHETNEDRFIEIFMSRNHKDEQANRLQAYRKQMGYTQKLLANEAHVNLRTLQQYETGAKRLNRSAANQLFNLAQVLGCDPNVLI